jgi:hypothetical protein
MRTLWSAATVRIYGGGVADQQWLSQLSKLIGNHDEIHRTTSWRGGERSVSSDVRQRRTLTTAELAALSPGRAIVLAGGRPVLVEPKPWFAGADAARIREAAENWSAARAGGTGARRTPAEPLGDRE